MLEFLLQGLLVGLAYVAPIGTQNIYVINSAIQKSRMKAYQTAFIVVFFDISLAISCFLGMGLLIEKFPLVKGIILLLGSVAVIYIGVGLIRSTSKLKEDVVIDENMLKVTRVCFAVTWLNPQAIVDGTLLLGGIRASLPRDGAIYFIIGVVLASALWFTGLTTVVTMVKTKISGVLKYINLICGTVIIFYGIRLGISFFMLLKK